MLLHITSSKNKHITVFDQNFSFFSREIIYLSIGLAGHASWPEIVIMQIRTGTVALKSKNAIKGGHTSPLSVFRNMDCDKS